MQQEDPKTEILEALRMTDKQKKGYIQASELRAKLTILGEKLTNKEGKINKLRLKKCFSAAAEIYQQTLEEAAEVLCWNWATAKTFKAEEYIDQSYTTIYLQCLFSSVTLNTQIWSLTMHTNIKLKFEY